MQFSWKCTVVQTQPNRVGTKANKTFFREFVISCPRPLGANLVASSQTKRQLFCCFTQMVGPLLIVGRHLRRKQLSVKSDFLPSSPRFGTGFPYQRGEGATIDLEGNGIRPFFAWTMNMQNFAWNWTRTRKYEDLFRWRSGIVTAFFMIFCCDSVDKYK